jgi:hypothetical protein
MDLNHIGHLDKSGNRRDVGQKVERNLLIERRIDGIGRGEHDERRAIGRRIDHRLRRNIAAGAGPILDDERLAQSVCQPLCHQTRQEVGGTAGSKSDNQAHRPRWIGLRPCYTRCDRERGSTRR